MTCQDSLSSLLWRAALSDGPGLMQGMQGSVCPVRRRLCVAPNPHPEPATDCYAEAKRGGSTSSRWNFSVHKLGYLN